VAKILHKSILRTTGDSLEVKVSNEINLCVPTLRFESALAGVVVAGPLVKVKLSASRLSTGPQSFFSQAAYHFRTASSFVKFCPPNALALAGPGRLTAPTSAQAPVASRFLRDTAIVVIVRSPFHDEV
jgi:hypothetical protein